MCCARLLWNVCVHYYIACSCQTLGSISNFVSKTTRPKHEIHHHGIVANRHLSYLDDHTISGS